MRILGIDPGIQITGYCLLNYENDQFEVITSGSVQTDKNKKEAEIELAQFVTKIQNGMVAEPKSITFKDFVEIWKSICSANKSPGTTRTIK